MKKLLGFLEAFSRCEMGYCVRQKNWRKEHYVTKFFEKDGKLYMRIHNFPKPQQVTDDEKNAKNWQIV